MTNLPAAIVFVNADLGSGIQTKLTAQLLIDEVMTNIEFNNRVSVDPNYPLEVHSNGLRILVLLPSLMDFTNRNLADVVLFAKGGLVTIEQDNNGPPMQSYQVDRVNIYDLLRYNKSGQVIVLPNTGERFHHRLKGIVSDEYIDSSGVHLPNPDNELNNPDFINRK